MDTIVTLSDNRLVATHYGLYNAVCGTGIMLGNLLTGTALDLGRAAGAPALPWLALAASTCSARASAASTGKAVCGDPSPPSRRRDNARYFIHRSPTAAAQQPTWRQPNADRRMTTITDDRVPALVCWRLRCSVSLSARGGGARRPPGNRG
jgi:hypothetical protein